MNTINRDWLEIRITGRTQRVDMLLLKVKKFNCIFAKVPSVIQKMLSMEIHYTLYGRLLPLITLLIIP